MAANNCYDDKVVEKLAETSFVSGGDVSHIIHKVHTSLKLWKLKIIFVYHKLTIW